MSRLEAAMARFSAALERLEAREALSGNGSRQLQDLREERQRLLARIAALEEESSSLAGLTQAVEARLDGAIAEIRTALSRNG